MLLLSLLFGLCNNVGLDVLLRGVCKMCVQCTTYKDMIEQAVAEECLVI